MGQNQLSVIVSQVFIEITKKKGGWGSGEMSCLCIFPHSVWLTSRSPSSSLPASAVQAKLPWRPAAPTAVWASTPVPGSEVRKTIKPRQDGGKKCIVGGPHLPAVTWQKSVWLSVEMNRQKCGGTLALSASVLRIAAVAGKKGLRRTVCLFKKDKQVQIYIYI